MYSGRGTCEQRAEFGLVGSERAALSDNAREQSLNLSQMWLGQIHMESRVLLLPDPRRLCGEEGRQPGLYQEVGSQVYGVHSMEYVDDGFRPSHADDFAA